MSGALLEISDKGDGVLSIQGTDNHSHAFALAPPADGHGPAGVQPVLVFIRFENVYGLSEIWESSTKGRALVGLSTAPQLGRAETQPESSEALAYVLAANWKCVERRPVVPG